jgi:hypothetical protein
MNYAYICAMEKNKFLQQSCSIHINEIDKSYFILIEHKGVLVLSVMCFEMPEVFYYWDETFRYYPYLWN